MVTISAVRQKNIRFRDGSGVHGSSKIAGKWTGWWADRTPMRNADDTLSFFDSAEEAIAALEVGDEGPRTGYA